MLKLKNNYKKSSFWKLFSSSSNYPKDSKKENNLFSEKQKPQ